MPNAVLDLRNVAAQCGQWEQPVCRLWCTVGWESEWE